MVNVTVDQLASETGWLHRLAVALVKDVSTADDLVQDTYLAAVKDAPTDGRPLKPWLARVLWNRVRMRSRGAGRRRAREHAFGELATPPARPDELVERVKLQRALADLVLELPVANRDVLLLHYFEGLTSSQIGTRLGISAGTVRWRLKQAIDELRDRLEQRSPNRAWVAPLGAFAKTAPRAKTAAIPKLLLLAATALAILALILRFEVGVMNGSTPSPLVAKATADREMATFDTALARATAASGSHGADQVFGAELLAIRGKVVDKTDHAVEGANVELDCGYGDDIAKPMQRTGVSGAFSFDVDPQCRYSIVATKGRARGYESWMRRFADQSMVIQLHPVSVAVIHVVDRDTGAPIDGAEISTQWLFGDNVRTTTGPNGIARVDVLLPVHVSVTAAHFVPNGRTLAASTVHDTKITYYDEREIDDTPTEAHLELRLAHGITVSGTAVGPDGQGVRGAGVALFGPVGADDPMYVPATTDANGTFELTVPRAGRYALTAQSRDLQHAKASPVDVSAGGRANVIAHLERRGELHGTVVDRSFKAVAGARVSVADNAIPPAVTDAKGRFTIHNIDGEIDLIARRGSDASPFHHVHVGVDNELVLQLGTTGITGIAVERDGTPVPGAQVWLNYCCEQALLVESRGAVADASGRFAFDVPGGDFVLSVKRDFDDDYEPEDDVKVSAGARDVRVVVP
jgi:RNA polymerase sigma-70 factor (ECF subfamily)